MRPLYSARQHPEFIDVPELSCLMVDGQGDPNTSPQYRAAISALYSTSYAAKFALKRAGILDYAVMPLEGWTALIVQPFEVTASALEAAKARAASKGQSGALERLRLERFTEGRAAQVLHLGPYSEEGPTIRALHDFIAENGCRMTGKNHEIYLGNPARSAPEKLRTIIRQPVAPA
jgi:hypothetical protein